VSSTARPLRIGVVTLGLKEEDAGGEVNIANGGVGVYIYQLIKHLQGLGDATEYTLIRPGHGRLDIYRQARTETVFLPLSPVRNALAYADLNLRRIAVERRLDLLHYPNQFGGAFLPRTVRRVVTVHDLTPLLYPRYHPWRRVLGYRVLLRPSLRAADHIIVPAAATAADLVARRLAPREKISVIPQGVDERFRPGVCSEAVARRYDLPARFVLTVGVLEPRKNHALLLQAIERLQRRGEPIGLVIVGRPGWHWRDPLDDPALAHLRPWVRVLRAVPDQDLVELYNRAEAFAYPSLYEGFGLPILEAMACGVPVVASSSSALPEVAGPAALLADPTDADDFAAQLFAVLRGPALRHRLIAAGHERARAYSWRRTAERTLAIYQRVCPGSPPRPSAAA